MAHKDDSPNLDTLSMLDEKGRRHYVYPADVKGRVSGKTWADVPGRAAISRSTVRWRMSSGRSKR